MYYIVLINKFSIKKMAVCPALCTYLSDGFPFNTINLNDLCIHSSVLSFSIFKCLSNKNDKNYHIYFVMILSFILHRRFVKVIFSRNANRNMLQ